MWCNHLSKKIVLGISGASGIVYTLKLIDILCKLKSLDEITSIYIIYTNNAIKVAKYELNIDLVKELLNKKCINGLYSDNDWESHLASSSSTIGYSAVVVPCSMNVVANLANGLQHRLLERALYNIMRLGGKIILVIRETPLSTIDLENLVKLSRNGVIIMPASPGFYIRPKTIEDLIDFIVGKILDVLGIRHSIYKRWQEPSKENSLHQYPQ